METENKDLREALIDYKVLTLLETNIRHEINELIRNDNKNNL